MLLLLLGLVQLLGFLFVKLRQPKVVGEILAGVVLGPPVIGRFGFAWRLTKATAHQANILSLFTDLACCG
jgi:Kef-type K+ transport system membrane component KefB